MNKYCWLVLVIYMGITVDLTGQSARSGYFRFRLKEQVMADYHNLLDTARERNYRSIEKYLSGRLFVYSINDSTTFIYWNPDTLQEQSQPVHVVKTAWKVVLSTGANEQWGSTLYSDTIIPPYWLNQLKIIAASVRFRLPGSFKMAESSPDGIFNVAYTIQEKSRNSIQVEKTKEAIYLPGIPFYRICIDSFRGVFNYDQPSGFIKNGFSYEVKRQKIGQRVLAKVQSESKVESCEPFLNEMPETAGWELLFTRPCPVFSRLGYVERAVKQAMNYEPVYTLNLLFQPVAATSADTGLQLIGRIRSSILRGSLSYKALRDVLDTVSLSSKEYAIFEDALVEAGTEEAQDILASLVSRKNEPAIFYKRLIIKAGITAPLQSKKLLTKLMSLRSDTTNPVLASVAGLALANNASLMKDEGMHNERGQILEFLRNCFFDSCRQQSDSLQWLQEAGNAGDAHVLTLAAYCLSASTNEFYKEALHSIRFIQGTKADSLLAIQLLINGKANISFLTEVCKLRYPSIIIRSAFYQFIHVNQDISLSVIQPFIDYLVSWQDEIKTLPAEILQAVSGMQEIERYCKVAILRATD